MKRRLASPSTAMARTVKERDAIKTKLPFFPPDFNFEIHFMLLLLGAFCLRVSSLGVLSSARRTFVQRAVR